MRSALRGSPIEAGRLGVERVALGGVEEGERAAGGIDLGVRPAGGLGVVESVRAGGEIDQVEPGELHGLGDVGVAEEERFDLGEFEEEGEEWRGVLEAGDFGEARGLGVVMDRDEGGSGGLVEELLLEPIELWGA
jgi:hypothetical protein